ncbi:uncharacterized protein LOC115568764 isoform X2 [Sparus aurata]|uniref:uncharacterized protein LOC115568764 isoform X2 n=1 Tax=Sparus aurata TaxID=8175 RepID=UPI0011C17A32|nr:uncharacterized protein LOC115568764 isoform X2 [Sparus aurata]
MEAVIGLLLMLLGVFHGVETCCDGRINGAQCYGALGGTVVLRLMDSASGIHKYQWFKNKTEILSGRKNMITTNLLETRSSFTPSDGTFRINNLSRTDGGEYTLRSFDSRGRLLDPQILQLNIQGVETYCDGRINGAQCYGALGGTVVLRLMDSASGIHRYQFYKNKAVILSGRTNRIITNRLEGRSSFTPSDGTFRINDLSRTDGGEYTLKSFDSRGRLLDPQILQLTIEAPVSSVLLVSECLSQGEMRVSCSSDGGDSPQYSWTLDGHTLTDAQLLSGNKDSNTITLRQDVSGQLVCSVSNHVSSVSQNKTISTCGFIFIDCISNGTHISQWVHEANNTLCVETPTARPSTTEGKEPDITVSNKPSPNNTTPGLNLPIKDEHWYIMAGVLAVLVILLVVGVAVVCAHKKRQNNKPKEEDDEQELTYADVRVVKRQVRREPQKEEAGVEYGEVRFSGRPRQSAQPAGDDCVYSMVCRDR